MLNHKDSINKYISYIIKNEYNYNVKYLFDKEKILYKTITMEDFDVDEFILKNDGIDVLYFINNLHNLAIKFGLSENKIENDDNITFSDYDVFEKLKDGIKAVE